MQKQTVETARSESFLSLLLSQTTLRMHTHKLLDCTTRYTGNTVEYRIPSTSLDTSAAFSSYALNSPAKQMQTATFHSNGLTYSFC